MSALLTKKLERRRPEKRGFVQKQEIDEGFSVSSGIKMVSRDKKAIAARAKVSFHLPNIPKPQTEFNILVNNRNTPFEHVWLEMSEDNSRFVHPLEKVSVLDFIDRDIIEDEITKPLSLESTPFKLVEGLRELKELAAKLHEVDEFADNLLLSGCLAKYQQHSYCNSWSNAHVE